MRSAVTFDWATSLTIVIGFLPAAVHFLLRAGRSSVCCTVSFWTPIVRPHALSGSSFFGLPLAVTQAVPAL